MGVVKDRKNRSEFVRSRRNKRVRNKIPRAAKQRRTIAMRTASPTVVRSRSMAHPAGRRKKQVVHRKRNYLPLTTSGAEIRLPAMPAVHVGWRALSGLMVAALVALIYALLDTPNLDVGVVEVAGLQRISSQDVNAVLSVYGASIFSISPADLREDLMAAFPEMTEITVKVKLPAKIIVAANERTPLIIWEYNGRSEWVDQDGVAFPKRGSQEGLVRVLALQAPPALTNDTEIQDQIIAPEMVNAIVTLNKQAPSDTNLLYDPDHGLGWQDVEGWHVFFGSNPQDMETRLAIYQAMVEMFRERRISPVFISVEYLHAPYYRLVAPE